MPSTVETRPLRQTGKTRWLWLDVLRGLAVLIVLCRHIPGWPKTGRDEVWLHDIWFALRMNGWLGVDLFFVLSGFLIGGLLVGEMQKHGSLQVGRFWIRRGFKIWPAYFAFVIALLVWLLVAPTPEVADAALWSDRLAKLWDVGWMIPLQLVNYFEPGVGLPTTHLWSVSVEEHFYVALPIVLVSLLLLPLSRASLRENPQTLLTTIAVIAVLVCLGLRLWTWHASPYRWNTHQQPTHLRIDSLLIGVALAGWTAGRPELMRRLRPWRWLLLPIGAAGVASVWFFPLNSLFTQTYGLLCIALGGVCWVLWAWLQSIGIEGQSDQRSLVVRTLLLPAVAVAAIGRWSYSIYLFHQPFVLMPIRWHVSEPGFDWSGFGLSGVMLFYIAAAVMLGAVAHALVEAPLVRLRDRLIPRRPSPAGA